jgi:shikimate dehydrogenase/3-dehydroquinate dehydratase type I
MMHRPTLLIATCPGRSVRSVNFELQRALEGGADAGEVRIDRLTEGEVRRLPELFPAPLPLVATLRSRAEGGEGPDAPDERADLFREMLRLPFQFIDVEPARDGGVAASVPNAAPRPTTVILSSHVPAATPTSDIRRLLERPRPAGGVAKVVLPCDFGRLWSDLLPGLLPLEAYAPCVLHTTGPTGPVLRAWAHRLGMFAVYASLPDRSPAEGAEAVEPTQLPVDQLRRMRAPDGDRSLFAVVGHPIRHSRSPPLHAFWMKHERRAGLYTALDIASASDLAESIAPLASGGFRGLNVTHPWKQVALTLASRAGPAAEASECANTLTFGPEEIAADNTDVASVRRRLSELRAQGTWDGSSIVVLGGGGAARSALSAISSMGSSAVVVARRREVARELSDRYGAVVGEESALSPARLVIHATPAGREGIPTLDLPWKPAIDRSTYVLDFVYEPVHPFLRERSRAVGATYEDGSRLLLYQAAESYGTWWGAPPSAELQDRALREVLCAA